MEAIVGIEVECYLEKEAGGMRWLWSTFITYEIKDCESQFMYFGHGH